VKHESRRLPEPRVSPQRPASAGVAERRGLLRRPGTFEEVPHRTRSQGLENVLRVIVNREHDELRVGQMWFEVTPVRK
jgi:hypothetical protein